MSKEQIDSFPVTEAKYDSKVISITIIQDSSSSIIKLDGIDDCIWCKILEMYIANREEKLHQWKKNCPKRR